MKAMKWMLVCVFAVASLSGCQSEKKKKATFEQAGEELEREEQEDNEGDKTMTEYED